MMHTHTHTLGDLPPKQPRKCYTIKVPPPLSLWTQLPPGHTHTPTHSAHNKIKNHNQKNLEAMRKEGKKFLVFGFFVV